MEDDEVILFERYSANEHTGDSFFVRLTVNTDVSVQFISVKNVMFSEALQNITPSMVVEFTDYSGDLLNNRLDTEAIYTLYFGKSAEESDQTRFKIVNIEHVNGVQGRHKQINFRVIFAHEHWEDTVAVVKNRAWSNKLYSDIVKDVVSTKGFNSIDVEPSVDVIDYTIQPHWSDVMILNNIQKKAKPQSLDGHYEFCGRTDNRFFFKSTYRLIREGIRDYRLGNMPILNLGGQPPKIMREEAEKNNQNVPNGFDVLSATEHYMGALTDGASAVVTGYYDWNTGQYHRNIHRFSEQNITQLSEWSLLKEETQFVSKSMFGGRDSTIKDKARVHLSDVSLSMQDIRINLVGQTQIHAGDIVYLNVVNDAETMQEPFNELYSGFYMVRKVVNDIQVGEQVGFTSQLTLTRHGMDNKRASGYQRSAKGRARFDV